MVGLQWLGYTDGWAAVVRALQWFGCGVRGTKTVACDLDEKSELMDTKTFLNEVFDVDTLESRVALSPVVMG